jgi:hypothetical protein
MFCTYYFQLRGNAISPDRRDPWLDCLLLALCRLAGSRDLLAGFRVSQQEVGRLNFGYSSAQSALMATASLAGGL